MLSLKTRQFHVCVFLSGLYFLLVGSLGKSTLGTSFVFHPDFLIHAFMRPSSLSRTHSPPLRQEWEDRIAQAQNFVGAGGPNWLQD